MAEIWFGGMRSTDCKFWVLTSVTASYSSISGIRLGGLNQSASLSVAIFISHAKDKSRREEQFLYVGAA